MALIGVIHTVLGEVLIFQRMRVKGVVPTKGGEVLRERNVRILWATWHLVTVLGFLVAVVIVHLIRMPAGSVESRLLVVSLIKRASLTSCPWDLAEFGGPAQYVSHWVLGLADGGGAHCFPGGHASAALAFVGVALPWLSGRQGSPRTGASRAPAAAASLSWTSARARC